MIPCLNLEIYLKWSIHFSNGKMEVNWNNSTVNDIFSWPHRYVSFIFIFFSYKEHEISAKQSKTASSFEWLWGDGTIWRRRISRGYCIQYSIQSLLEEDFQCSSLTGTTLRNQKLGWKSILLESFPVHYTIIQCLFIYRETHFLGSVSKGVMLPIIKLCTEGSHLNSTLLILCKIEPYWSPALSQHLAEVTRTLTTI